jgi:hypothetical protein
MKRYFLFSVLLPCSFACRITPDSNRNNAEHDRTRVYLLRLNPPAGSQYYYTISSRSEYKFEAGDKKVDNRNKTNAGVKYNIRKDSAGNFIFQIRYDKLHIDMKNAEEETEMDASNAGTSVDPVEKMLGTLTSSAITATVTPAGQVSSVDGFKEITDKMMTGFTGADENSRVLMRQRLEQMIGNGIIKNNMDQLFAVFPDSAIHIGDRWKMYSTQLNELNLKTHVWLTLVKIEDGLATIHAEGEISNDSATINLLGYKVSARLKGTEEGEYQMDIQTGMMIGADLSAKVDGSIGIMGQEVPLAMETKVRIDGQKLY